MALYKFTDTIERALRAELPSEALNFNGVFLENEIDGYRTLNVTGRESIESEIYAIETKARHGARYRSRRHLPRIITVSYMLSAKTATELMEKFNKLNYILDAEEATLIFDDEPDKFFIGTRQNMKPPKEGVLTTRGEIEFYCADPLKYSVREYEVTAEDGAISTIYNGTAPNPPKFRVRAHGDIGFVEFLKDTARITCGMSYNMTKSKSGQGRVIFNTKTSSKKWAVMGPLMDWRFLKTYISGVTGVFGDCDPLPPPGSTMEFWDGMEDVWYYDTETINGEQWLIPHRSRHVFALLSNGASVSANDITIVEYDDDGSVKDITDITNDGSDSPYQLHGGAMQYDISTTRKNFEFDFESRIYAERTDERGAQAFTVYGIRETTTIDGDIATITTETVRMCGLTIQKSAVGTNRLEISVYIGDDKADTIVMQATKYNPVFGMNSLKCSLARFGNVYTLRLGNETYTYQTNETLIPTQMTVFVMDYADSPVLKCNAVRYVQFVEHTASSAKAVTNIIRNGDDVVIDCAAAEITVNGVSEPEMGNIMNQWDGMDLVNGENNIGINIVRDTKKKAPEITMTYREAYL